MPIENIQAGAEVGKANGLTVLLDAETYDYTYHLRAGEGFKVNISMSEYLRGQAISFWDNRDHSHNRWGAVRI